MEPTPFGDLNRVLEEMIGGIRAILGEQCVAACLQGSLAVGDFDAHSDADFIIAVTTALTAEQVDALQTLHAWVRALDNPWAAHLEGSYFPVDVLRTCTRRREPLWFLDHGSNTLVPSTHCNMAVVRQVIRERGIRLAGAAPASLVDPVPVEVLRGEIVSMMCGWGQQVLDQPEAWANRFYQGYLVLNYCRMWADLTTGTVGSKRRGAAWAKARLDPTWTDLIDRAWDTRPDPGTAVRTPADPHDYRRTLALLTHIMAASRAEFGSVLTPWP